eukprot:6020395-Heterocapsa_arctica.AAC.1
MFGEMTREEGERGSAHTIGDLVHPPSGPAECARRDYVGEGAPDVGCDAEIYCHQYDDYDHHHHRHHHHHR